MKRVVVMLGRRGWLLYPILIFIAMAAWSISSPPGSSPDEDFHLVSAWCSLGTREGLCAPGGTTTTRVVPAELLRTPCYAFHAKKAGNCDLTPGQTVETDRFNFGSYYPNGFYTFMGLFASPEVTASVIAMRLVNTAIYAAGLAALLFLSAPDRRSNYMLGSIVILVPLGMFTVASINPSSWAITSATLLWASAVEFVRASRGRRRYGLAALAAFALVLGVSARADAAAYGGLAIVLAWLVTAKFSKRTLKFGVIAGVVFVGAAVWALSLGSSAGLFGGVPLRPEDLPSGWWQRLQDLPGFYADTFSRGLGWLDTRPRPATWVLASISYFTAIFWGLRRVHWRKAASLGILLALGTAVPLVIATARHAFLAETLQERYFLPLMVLAAMIALAEDNPDGPEFNWAQAAIVIVALTAANGNALHTNLRRYITGLDGQWFNLNINMQWWWYWAPPPMVVFGVGAAAFMGAVAVAALTGLKERDEPEPATIPARRALL